MNILERIDQVLDPENRQKVLYNPNDRHAFSPNELGVSRFNYGTLKRETKKDEPKLIYRPYDLTFDNIYRLSQSIVPIDSNPINETMSFAAKDLSKFFTVVNGKVIFSKPMRMADLLEYPGLSEEEKYGFEHRRRTKFETYRLSRHDITIMGILAIILQDYYLNTEFKTYVETEYLSKWFTKNVTLDYWILKPGELCKYQLTSNDIEQLILKNNASGGRIFPSEQQIPFTFKWVANPLEEDEDE